MTVWLWIGFVLVVFGLLALDLGVLNRKVHVISTGEALIWTGLWVAVALAFTAVVYFLYEHHWLGIGLDPRHVCSGKEAALLYLTGYIIEESLSLDNMFVIALIFAYFQVAPIYQHRVLFWGIMGALVLRGVMILAGAALIYRFSWMIYVFGGLLLLSAAKMLFMKEEKFDPEKNVLLRLVRRFCRLSTRFEGQNFFTRMDGRLAITPMFLVLVVVESSDVIFAVDSIPAIFAVTTDPFIVFTSNVFAILGLRSLYFVLAGMMRKFQYMKISLVFVLGYVGVKMLLSFRYHIPALVSLCVICGLLLTGILASVIAARRNQADGGNSDAI
ncbi:MAG TPA: TerC family protein [Phycisphaerae bacterium]|nr:TerC family protein [Phycisphaerae bacterium]